MWELRAIEEFGELGQAVFDFIAQGSETGVSGLFGEEAMASYAARTGGKVPTSQVQKLAEKMISANLIAPPRPRHLHRGRPVCAQGVAGPAQAVAALGRRQFCY